MKPIHELALEVAGYAVLVVVAGAALVSWMASEARHAQKVLRRVKKGRKR